MCLAYVSWTTGDILNLKLSELIKPKGFGYRFAFNGQEGDDEVAGKGNSYTAEFWQYDSRLGRRFNRDPKSNASISVYACFANNPIIYTDVKGDTIKNNFSSKPHKVAYNLWTKHTKGGKTFAKDYGIGGRYEHITVDLQSGDGSATDLNLVKKDGTSVDVNYKSDVNIPNLRAIANGTNKDEGHLVYTVTIGTKFNPDSRGYSHAHQIVQTMDDILHEIQHVGIDMIWLKRSGRMRSAYYHHKLMKTKEREYYRERYNQYKQFRKVWIGDYERNKEDGYYNDEDSYINDQINDFYYQSNTREKDD